MKSRITIAAVFSALAADAIAQCGFDISEGPDGAVLDYGEPYENSATQAFPSLSACLNTSGAEHTLNGSAMTDFEELKVCLFRMITYLGTPDETRNWMASQSFTFELESHFELHGHKYNCPESGILVQNYRWDTGENGLLFDRNAPDQNQSSANVIAITVYAKWTDDGSLVDISHDVQGRWTK